MNVAEWRKRAQTESPLPFIEIEQLLADNIDDQLTAHGPDGDGAISGVGADAEGITFVDELELAAPYLGGTGGVMDLENELDADAVEDEEPTRNTWSMSENQEDGAWVSVSFGMSTASEDCDGSGLPDCG